MARKYAKRYEGKPKVESPKVELKPSDFVSPIEKKDSEEIVYPDDKDDIPIDDGVDTPLMVSVRSMWMALQNDKCLVFGNNEYKVVDRIQWRRTKHYEVSLDEWNTYEYPQDFGEHSKILWQNGVVSRDNVPSITLQIVSTRLNMSVKELVKLLEL